MNDIIPSDPRAVYVAGLREFADFLESNPDVTVPDGQRLLLSLSTNPVVEEYAAEHGLTVDYDNEGNASADMRFGAIRFHAYGYVDFAKHCEANDERGARTWADRNGLEIVVPLVSDDTIRQADSQLALNTADREAADRIVAYRSNGGRLLRCLAHSKDIAGDDFVPVASEDLPDGGICTYPDCGTDVLIGATEFAGGAL